MSINLNMMKKTFLSFYFAFFFLATYVLPLQAQGINVKQILADEFMYKFARNVSDYLYFDGDNSHYLISKSPLSFFSWKEKAFDKYPEIQLVEYKSAYGGMLGFSGKYHMSWLIKNNNLYMCNLSFYTTELKPEYIKHIEYLADRKFDGKLADKDPKTPIGEYGLMPATWFSDTIYVKKAKNFNEEIDVWKIKPYQRLIFQKGKLVSDTEFENKTWYVEVKR